MKILTEEEFKILPKDQQTGCVILNESFFWYKEGELHRDDGPAVEYYNGSKYWYVEGYLHRDDGPACEYYDGGKVWCKKGVRHRDDGPAAEWTNGKIEYWLWCEEYSYNEWYAIVNGLEKFI